jgi:hypothetical protein
MAKKYYKAPVHQTGTIITTKTHFGSTSDMIVDHTKYKYIKDNGPIIINDSVGIVVCKDDKGFYMTLKNRIDSGLADPNRYANSHMRLDIIEAEENVSSA